MDLIGYSLGIKEMIRGSGNHAIELANELPMGTTKKYFGFAVGNKTIHVIAPTKDVMQTIFDILNKTIPQEYYDYSIRLTEDSKTKTISKRGHPSIPLKKLKNEMTTGGTLIRIYYEMLTTPDFEVTNSEYEGTIIKCKDDELLRRVFVLLVGLFPFVETTKETKKVGVECNFDVGKYDAFKKEQKKKATVVCNLTMDGKPVGSKSCTFTF